MAYETPDHNMEMPTPCQKCGGWFDLNDGVGSEKWFPNTVICEECGREEEKEIERDEEIEDLKNSLSDAEFTVKECKEQLAKLGVLLPAESAGAGVWVKAGERLPKEYGRVTWRWFDKEAAYSGYSEKGFIYDTGGARVDPLYYGEIEWLDETGSAAQPVIAPAEHEREGLATGFEKVRKLFERHENLMDGNAIYPYNDEAYRKEVRFMFEQFNALFKDTWAQVKSHSGEYRKKIIEEYKKEVEEINDDELFKLVEDITSNQYAADQMSDIIKKIGMVKKFIHDIYKQSK